MVTPSLICFTPRKEELLTIVTELSSKVLNMLSITLLPKKIKKCEALFISRCRILYNCCHTTMINKITFPLSQKQQMI